MPDQNLDTRRDEARRAMEGDERRKAREIREQSIGKRRVDARRAMESPTHRAKREARERAEREISGAEQAKAEAERATRAEAARLIAEAKAKEVAQATAAHEELVAHVQAARQATAEIKTIKDLPTHLSSIRTLKTDMAEAVSRGGSMAGAIIQQGEMRGAIRQSSEKKHSRIIVTIIFILIFLGALAWGGTLAYQKWVATSPAPIVGPLPPAAKPVFFRPDRQTSIDTTNQLAPALLGKIRVANAVNQTPGTIDEIIFTKNNTPLAFRAWQTLLALPFPDGLLRNVDTTFMFGLYRGEINSVPFILLKTKAPAQSYAQLLLWEKGLPAVWDALIGKPPALPTTASSTSTIAPTFRDRIIQNLDTRILEGVGVTQPALYGLLDSNTIILTQTRAAYLEILTRLRAVK